MSTRVTQNMLNQNMLFNLSRTDQAMQKYQDQASSGKKINKPSDDPVTAGRAMYYRSSLNEIDQYKLNADDGISWLTTTDDALDEVNSVLQRVRELTVQGLNGTNDDSARTAIAEEISQLKEHLGEVANSQIAGKFIFAGTDVKNPPYRADENDPNSVKEFRNSNKEKLELQVGQNNSVQINIPGIDVFQQGGGLFSVLSNIVSNLKSGTLTSDSLGKLDGQIDNILTKRSEIGARMNRMELSQSRLENLEVSTTALLSKEEDADLSQVIINLKSEENVQRAALSIGARVIQPSLVDFLR
ncbi:flagellar hook-associated protein FlgL [Bacillus xiapuensis]|uniref:Flagellar hook-associated protein FlgL n=1 Tax=Bacillus xiapuensis TaxID=2014075 RepID=A0ABU6NE24_9BACI|nr:flagellar hook-associated protein FlgL [Bacillus xiapuensis]